MIRMEVLLIRKGRHHWREWFPTPTYDKANIGYVYKYIPEVVYCGLFIFGLCSVLLWLVFAILLWDVTWEIIWGYDLLVFLLKYLTPMLINTAISLALAQFVWKEEHLVFRKLFLVYDTYMAVTGVIASLISALMRPIFAIVFVIVALFRFEHSPMAAWVDRELIQMDYTSKSAAAVVKMSHTHQNPIVTTFTWLLTSQLGSEPVVPEWASWGLPKSEGNTLSFSRRDDDPLEKEEDEEVPGGAEKTIQVHTNPHQIEVPLLCLC